MAVEVGGDGYGDTVTIAIYVGDTEASRIYIGSQLAYEAA